MSMGVCLWENVWCSLYVYVYMYVSVAGSGTATGLYDRSRSVFGLTRLCYTFSHNSLQPPFSVLMVPPERECVKLLCVCVLSMLCPSTSWFRWFVVLIHVVFLKCCEMLCKMSVSEGLVALVVWLKCENCFVCVLFVVVILLENVLMVQVAVITTQNYLPPFCIPLNSHHFIILF